jgi:hypothetical protein
MGVLVDNNKKELKYQNIAPWLLILCIILGIWGTSILQIFVVGVSRSRELGKIQSRINSFSFQCPDGSDFRICILFPKKAINKNLMETFSGTLKIYKDNTVLWSHQVKLTNLPEAYWLSKREKNDIEDFQEFIITAYKDPFKYISLENVLKKDNAYKIELSLNSIPPQGTSLWFHYKTIWWKVKKTE